MSTAARHDDTRDRELIEHGLDETLMVEAGAGSGKTTSLVGRIVNLIARGTPVDRIAAVTFTRKAAGELRERLQERLEQHIREAARPAMELERFDRARREIDAAFLGTIHSFCARLLRERPLEAALDPSFEELDELGWQEALDTFWRRWVDDALRADDPDIRALRQVGIDPRLLREAFAGFVGYPDVEFPVVKAIAPDTTGCLRALETLLRKGLAMMPTDEPASGWDDLQRTLRRLAFLQRVSDWSDRVVFCEMLSGLSAGGCKVTQNRWGSDKQAKAEAKALGEEWTSFLDQHAAPILRQWREHRYPAVIAVLGRASRDFARERFATARLSFEDLLLAAAHLLRENPGARRELGHRWAHLLVDEFQDTDPIQAEVCLLLSSDPEQGNDWRTVTPRPGSLFVVGDPKQSIYRFRRADIQVYDAVKARFAQFGKLVRLVRNFRSMDAVATLVNGHFEPAFSAAAEGSQADFAPLVTNRPAQAPQGVFRYGVSPSGRSNGEIYEIDAAMISAWIEKRIAAGRRAGEFLILTPTRDPIATYARELSKRNIPVSTTGASLPQERELRELHAVLSAIADPDNPVLVAAALEGCFFGLSPAQLWEASRQKLTFSIAHRPNEDHSATGAALATLHHWWRVSQRHPTDVLVETILDESGLLAYSASQELGDARAGALLHIVESLRAASTDGASGVVDAMERIDLLLGNEAPDVSLRPGRADAVRVMNIHKAKGLEGEIVILAAPKPTKPFPVTMRVVRDDRGHSRGWMLVATAKDGVQGGKVLAQPTEWDEVHAPAERRFSDAERTRLLYVAATRPKEELLIAECRRSGGETALWSTLASATLPGSAEPFPTDITDALTGALERAPAAERRKLEVPASEVASAAAEAQARMAHAAIATHVVTTVTQSAKRQREETRAYDLAGPRGLGVEWGRAVHRSIEGALRGRRGDVLAMWIDACAAEEGLAAEQASALQHLVQRVMQGDAWTRLTAGESVSAELSIMQVTPDASGVPRVVEGVIDAAAVTPGGWLVVDWKTDRVSDAEWEGRRATYLAQLQAYEEMLSGVTGLNAMGGIERLEHPEG